MSALLKVVYMFVAFMTNTFAFESLSDAVRWNYNFSKMPVRDQHTNTLRYGFRGVLCQKRITQETVRLTGTHDKYNDAE